MKNKKMNDNLTEIVFLLDRSGSMSGMEQDTIGGYNNFIKSQKGEVGKANLTTVLFDNYYEVLHDRINITKVKPMTHKEYFVRGSTALLDAVGKTIQSITQQIDKTEKEKQPTKVLFVITTDGMENSSREYTMDQIKKMIEHQKSGHGWEFIFLGANIDATQTARDIGIDDDRSSNFSLSKRGVKAMYSVMSKTASSLRSSSKIQSGWKTGLDQ